MTLQVLQNPTPRFSRGLAIGWGIAQIESSLLRKALPEWSIVTTVSAPQSVTFQDYAAARRITGQSREAPLIVFGFWLGAITVRTILLSRFVEPWAAVAVALPVPDPEQAWQTDAWQAAAARLPGGLGLASYPGARSALGLTGTASGPEPMTSFLESDQEHVDAMLRMLGNLAQGQGQ